MYLVLGGIVTLMVTNALSPGIVAILGALVLAFTGVIEFEQVSAGLGDPIVLMIASLFVVSEALDVTGVTGWAGRHLARLGRGRSTATLVLVMVACTLLTALISVNGAVAALVPMTVIVAMRTSEPAQMLMPLAFAAHAGSMLTLTGTPVNLLLNEQLDGIGLDQIGFLEFSWVGVPLVLGTLAITALIGPRVLPRGRRGALQRDLSLHEETLRNQYLDDDADGSLLDRERGVAEVLVHPRSPLIGEHAYPGMVTDSGRFVVLAIHRGGHHKAADERVELLAGDVLLIGGTWDALDEGLDAAEVVVVDEPVAVRRQALPFGPGSRRALAVLAGMVVLLVTGAVPAATATLLAALAMVLTRTITIDQAYAGINWKTIVLIAAMIPVSAAVTSSGAAANIGDAIVDLLGGHDTRLLLLGLFVLVATLGQLISNMATALIVMPIGVAAALDIGVDPTAVLMCITVAAAAALLTPVATPANLIVQHAGGYRFGDYWKLGLPLLAWYGVVAVLLVPLIWTP